MFNISILRILTGKSTLKENSSVHEKYEYTRGFFISITFTSNTRLKLAKNQANAKQYLEAELLLFENHSHSSSILLSKNNSTYSKK